MIAYLKGNTLFWGENRLVVDVGGVGYEVFAPLSTTTRTQKGEPVELFIHTLVREDAFQLYGFLEETERDLFLLLIGVSGVGPKVAMAVLSSLPLPELVGAISREDVAMLSKVNGVGKKTASRLALELKDKVGLLGIAAPMTMAAGAAPAPAGGLSDAVSALVNLGYSRARAESAVQTVAATGETDLKALIRKGLAALS